MPESRPGYYQDASAAVAYAVMRMPACYAATSRVLHELREARPHLQPVSMLDFGAGPGTATWAARQVGLAPGCGKHLYMQRVQLVVLELAAQQRCILGTCQSHSPAAQGCCWHGCAGVAGLAALPARG